MRLCFIHRVPSGRCPEPEGIAQGPAVRRPGTRLLSPIHKGFRAAPTGHKGAASRPPSSCVLRTRKPPLARGHSRAGASTHAPRESASTFRCRLHRVEVFSLRQPRRKSVERHAVKASRVGRRGRRSREKREGQGQSKREHQDTPPGHAPSDPPEEWTWGPPPASPPYTARHPHSRAEP